MLMPPLLIWAALTAAPAAAQTPIPLTPQEAATLDRAMTRPPGLPAPCTGTGAGNEIVVCAHREKPIEFEREPGEIVRHINEPGFGIAALAADRCTRLCNVGVTVDLVGAARAVPKIVRHILGRD
jgi:hypothetical protein